MPHWLERPSGRTVLAAAALIALVALGVYSRAPANGFVGFDDDVYVTDNPHLRDGLSWAGVRYAFTTTDVTNWHPVTWLSYLLDVTLFGPGPWGFHATNVALHAANAALLLGLLWTATGALIPSVVVATLFAVHPLNVESVAWIAERKNVLSTTLWLLLMIAYVSWTRRPRPAGYLLVALGLTLALMAKPMAVTAPFVLLLLDYWPLDRVRLGWRRLVVEKLPLFALILAASAVTFVVQRDGGAMGSNIGYPLAIRIENAVWAYGQYLAKMAWPSGLAAFYPHPQGALPDWQVALVGVALAAATAALTAARTHAKPALVGWLWYLGTLVPVIGLVQVGSQAMADRYAYVPLIGIFIGLAFGAAALIRHGWLRSDVVTALVLAFMLASAMTTWRQVRVWRNTETLFGHTIRLEPGAWVAHYNLGNEYAKQGRYAEAVARFQVVTRDQPGFAPGFGGLGNALSALHRNAEALAPLERAVQINPTLVDVHNNLGITYAALGRGDDAIRSMRTAVTLEPDFVAGHLNLAMALRNAGRLDEALAEATRVLELTPGHPLGTLQRGLTLVALTRLDEARALVAPLQATAPELAAQLIGALGTTTSGTSGNGQQRP
jgi:tetratricopeptide (TPR) repeat protein